jgi:class 3 adenylate cyclase
VVTICFTDIEGYTSLSHRMHEQEVDELVQEHNRIVRACIKKYNGYEVKTLGDGFMIAFASPCDGLLCALNTQCEIALWNAGNIHRRIWVRIGLHSGSVISAEGDYAGAAVNAAARISALAAGGQVYVSEALKILCDSQVAITFIGLGSRSLKGFQHGFNLYEVDWHARREFNGRTEQA